VLTKRVTRENWSDAINVWTFLKYSELAVFHLSIAVDNAVDLAKLREAKNGGNQLAKQPW